MLQTILFATKQPFEFADVWGEVFFIKSSFLVYKKIFIPDSTKNAYSTSLKNINGNSCLNVVGT